MRSALTHLVRVLTAAVLGYDLWRFLDTARAYLASPYSRDYGEGCVLAMVQLLAERGSYFPHMRDYPFVHGNYPPVFIALNWPFYVLFGPSLLAPRLLSLAATCGLLAVLFLLLLRLCRDRAASAFLACALLAPWFVETWAALGRVDMLACFFSVVGLLVWERDPEPAASRRRAYPLFWLAFFTKQNALLAPAAVLAHLFLEDRRAFRRPLLSFALPLLALFGALVLLTGGEAWRHLVTYTAAAEYEWPRMIESYEEFLLATWPAQALIVTALVLVPRGVLAGAGRAFVLYWLLNLVGLVTIAKAGAAQNYFIEPWLATLLLAALALRELAARFPGSAAVSGTWVLAVVLVASLVRTEAKRLPQAIRSPDRARDFIALTKAIRETDGPILSENLSILVVNRKAVLVEPFGLLQLSRRGYLRLDQVIRDCERGVFSLVVTEHRLREVAGLGECLDRRYTPWQDLGPYQALRPR